jgi:vacuolar-type H+-ATPase subunit H
VRSRSDSTRQEATGRAIERVLRAEREAADSIAQAHAQAQTLLDAARSDALDVVNRAAQRIARWQQAHSEALVARLAALRTHAAVSADAVQPPNQSAINGAAMQLAARLTGAEEEPPR